MRLAGNVIVSAFISIVVLTAGFNVPAKWLDISPREKNLGTSLSTISSSDNISSFPSVYNANIALTPNLTESNTYTGATNIFTGLNIFGNSSSSISSCMGPCYFGRSATSTFNSDGSLTLITPLVGPSGGTGTTGPSLYRVLFGNDTGDNSNVITNASSTGSLNQFLTSQGPGAYPIWTTAAVDTTGIYAWSGSTTLSYGNTASTTLDGKFGFGINVVAASTSPMWYAIDQGAVNAYAIQLDPPISKYTTGLQIAFKPSATNTSAATINVNNIGTVNIKRGKNGNNVTAGDIRPNDIVHLTYDGGSFILDNPKKGDFESVSSVTVVTADTCVVGSWRDLQLGHITGTTTSMVMLSATFGGTVPYIAFRTNGDTASTTSGVGYLKDDDGNEGPIGNAIVKTDTNATVEWNCGNQGSGNVTIRVEAFW